MPPSWRSNERSYDSFGAARSGATGGNGWPTIQRISIITLERLSLQQSMRDTLVRAHPQIDESVFTKIPMRKAPVVPA